MVPSLADSLRSWLPEILLGLGAMGSMLFGAFDRAGTIPAGEEVPPVAGPEATPRPKAITRFVYLTLLAVAVALLIAPPIPPSGEAFFGLIRLDPMSQMFRWFALGIIALVVLMAACSADVAPRWFGEYLGLFLVVGVGLMLMAEANHLLMAYLSIELVSLTSYILVTLTRDARSSEAGLKYLLFGALSSGIMLFGMSLLFGLTGQLSFPAIHEAISRLDAAGGLACAVAMALLLVGLAFKISMAPFHMWTPDVYEGAPVPVTAMLSVGPKAAGLALLLRLIPVLDPIWSVMAPVIVWLALVTMTIGNVVALVQTNVKRLLAYSTIAQVGYLLIGLCVNTPMGSGALVIYLLAYLFMNLGVFACIVAVVSDTGSESVEAFRGLARRSPVMALCCALFLLSLAGLPPLFGFIGKFLLFGAAIQSQAMLLAVGGVVNSAIALYYYVNIIRQMYLLAPAEAKPLRPAIPLQVAVGVCGVATVIFGVFPSVVLSWWLVL